MSQLKREVGVFGAMMMGLGSIVGTGVFVSIGIGAGVIGPAVILAIAVAALIATFNGLSSAQLAANHPVSGGTYEYGYRWLHPSFGFLAGWMFLCAKSASAATAALGFSGYALHLTGFDAKQLTVPVAFATVVAITLLVLGGIRRSNFANIVIVGITLITLAAFVLAGIPQAWTQASENLDPFFAPTPPRTTIPAFLEACALMFVAFTGYGRIATLGEEVVRPRHTIPRAIIVTLIVSSLLYIAVGLVAVASTGANSLSGVTLEKVAPLEIAARSFDLPFIPLLVSIGAMTAMLGVLLNLVLGLSRVLLAMGRRHDVPAVCGRVSKKSGNPNVAVIAVGLLIGLLVLIGNVKTTWSFSAFTVLIYYAVTNLAALKLSPTERLYPRVIAWLGLLGCLSLAFWVEPQVWLVGLAFILVGFAVQIIARKVQGEPVLNDSAS